MLSAIPRRPLRRSLIKRLVIRGFSLTRTDKLTTLGLQAFPPPVDRASSAFRQMGSPDSHWILFSTQAAGVNGSIQADHSFDSALSVGQAVRLDFANSSVAAAAGSNPNGVVGVSLTSGGTPVATFKFTGGDTLYRYDDAGAANQSTGTRSRSEAFRHWNSASTARPVTRPHTATRMDRVYGAAQPRVRQSTG